MKSETTIRADEEREEFIEGVDYYFENGFMILTARFLLKRGYCCRNGCRNCPFTATEQNENTYNK